MTEDPARYDASDGADTPARHADLPSTDPTELWEGQRTNALRHAAYAVAPPDWDDSWLMLRMLALIEARGLGDDLLRYLAACTEAELLAEVDEHLLDGTPSRNDWPITPDLPDDAPTVGVPAIWTTNGMIEVVDAEREGADEDTDAVPVLIPVSTPEELAASDFRIPPLYPEELCARCSRPAVDPVTLTNGTRLCAKCEPWHLNAS